MSMISLSSRSSRPVELEAGPHNSYMQMGDSETIPLRPRHSMSNLSTTSTLHEVEIQRDQPLPPVQITPYEQFVAHAREAEARRWHAWVQAEERRLQSRSWPHDPWRGGFGPPAGDTQYVYVERTPRTAATDGATARRSRSGRGEEGVRGWLSQNGLLRR